MRHKTPKEKGYAYIAVSGETRKILDDIMLDEMCSTRPEALRRALLHWKRSKSKYNAADGI